MTLLLTDNEELLNRFLALLKKKGIDRSSFDFAYSPVNRLMANKYEDQTWIVPLRVKDSVGAIIKKYNLVLSLHSKQLCPPELVRNVRCINIHPGLNPHNRGWFPQVFSIINHLPCGATIHEMDDELDHGPIIAQKEIKIELTDTSISVYDKVLDAEIELLEAWLERILKHDYETFVPEEGNVNLKKDFDALCHLNLNDVGTMAEHIDLLRALTHGNYANAFFIDKNGEKIFVKIELFKKNDL